VNEWSIEWVNSEWLNEGISELMNEWFIERVNKWMHHFSEPISEWINALPIHHHSVAVVVVGGCVVCYRWCIVTVRQQHASKSRESVQVVVELSPLKLITVTGVALRSASIDHLISIWTWLCWKVEQNWKVYGKLLLISENQTLTLMLHTSTNVTRIYSPISRSHV